MAIDAYVIASQNKSGGMILELDVIVVVPPVFEVLGELHVEQVSVAVVRYVRIMPEPIYLPTTLLSSQCSRR
jgi:hypothetical protein